MTHLSLRARMPLACAAVLAVGVDPEPASAQAGFSRTVRNTIPVSVPGMAGVSAVTAPRVTERTAARVEITAVLTVKANAPYRVHAYANPAEIAKTGAPVSVRVVAVAGGGQ